MSGLSPEIEIVTAQAEQALRQEWSAHNAKQYAVSLLAAGRIPKAVVALEDAVERAPQDPSLWSDLAAAYSASGDIDAEHSADLPRALEAIETAIELTDSRPEYWFNRAIITEKLGLKGMATESWRRCMLIEADGEWRKESVERAEALEGRKDPFDAAQVRDRLFDVVLPSWADAMLSHRTTDEASYLEEAHIALAKLDSLTPDTLARDVWSATTASITNKPTRRATLEGLVAYGKGRRAYSSDLIEDAQILFVGAYRELSTTDHPLSRVALTYLGVVEYRKQNFDKAREHLLRALKGVTVGTYPALRGRIGWTLGLVSLNEGRVRDAVELYRQAVADLRLGGEAQNTAFVTGLLATAYDLLGDPVRLWQARVEALRGSSREGTLLRAAYEARRERWLRAAADFALEALQNARRRERPATVADSMRVLSTIEWERGNRIRGRHLLDEARRLASTQTGTIGRRLQAEIDVAEAVTAEPGRNGPSYAAAASRAIRYFESALPPAVERLPELFLARARLARAEGQTGLARRDLTDGLAAFVRMRRFVEPGVDQATLADVARQISDELVDLLAESDGRSAFEEVERARAWDLPPATRPVGIDRLVRFLPDGVAVVVYVVGDTKSRVWVVKRGVSRLIQLPEGRARLAKLASAVRADPDSLPARKQLGAAVMAPLLNLFTQVDTLAIVPDGPLHLIPFAALPGAESDYLIEEHAVVLCPNVSRLLQERGALLSGSRQALAIGNPAFSKTRWPELADLPGAEREGRALDAFRGHVTHLNGFDATISKTLSLLPRVEVVHFAGHAIANEFSPDDSELVLANMDRLTAREVRRLSLSHVRLVVLAACDSAVGFLPRGEGPLGLARAFQAAGVGSVVASLWNVEDSSSEALVRKFYAALGTGMNPPTALREAQIEAIRSGSGARSSPRYWSNFVAIGAAF